MATPLARSPFSIDLAIPPINFVCWPQLAFKIQLLVRFHPMFLYTHNIQLLSLYPMSHHRLAATKCAHIDRGQSYRTADLAP